ncbi:hypothetical protein LTR95_007911, partial [Oleoguttula sp. CCFEE 5521]
VEHSEAIKILVGKEPKFASFGMCKDTICEQSKSFAAACSVTWAEGQAGVIKLPEEDPEVIAKYIGWLYTDTIAVNYGVFLPTYRRDDLIAWYLLADRLDDKKLRNHTISQMVGMNVYVKCLLDGKFVDAVCEETAPNSSLRKMLVEVHIALEDRGVLRTNTYPQEFILDLACQAMDTPCITTQDSRAGIARFLE